MSGHDGGHARLDGRTERSQLDFLQARRLVLDHRQFQVGIEAGVAVTGKVLPAGGHALRFQRTDEDRAQTRDLARILRQRTVADDRVGGIGVHVEHRREVQRDTDAPQFPGEGAAETLCQIRGAAPPERHQRRPLREWRPQALHPAAFLVDADPRGNRRELLDVVRHLCHLQRRIDIPGKQNHTAEIEFAGDRAQLHRKCNACKSNHDQLSETTPQACRHPKGLRSL